MQTLALNIFFLFPEFMIDHAGLAASEAPDAKDKRSAFKRQISKSVSDMFREIRHKVKNSN